MVGCLDYWFSNIWHALDFSKGAVEFIEFFSVLFLALGGWRYIEKKLPKVRNWMASPPWMSHGPQRLVVIFLFTFILDAVFYSPYSRHKLQDQELEKAKQLKIDFEKREKQLAGKIERLQSEKEILIADNDRLRELVDPSIQALKRRSKPLLAEFSDFLSRWANEQEKEWEADRSGVPRPNNYIAVSLRFQAEYQTKFMPRVLALVSRLKELGIQMKNYISMRSDEIDFRMFELEATFPTNRMMAESVYHTLSSALETAK